MFKNKFLRYIQNIGLGVDETGNALVGGDGHETISSRAAKAQRAGKVWGCVLCRFLNLFQKNHCEKALNDELGYNAVIPDDSKPKE